MTSGKLRNTMLTTALALCLMSAGASGPTCGHCCTDSVSVADHLISRLAKVQAAGKTLFGHSDDTAYGTHWWATPGRSDVLSACGDYPAMINWDLGMMEMGSARNLDSVSFQLIRSEAVKQHLRGGINSFSWHPRNIRTLEDSWSLRDTGDAVKDAVTPGTPEHALMTQWLDTIARYVASIKTDCGEKVPVIFRPWHEQSGSWFWWSMACTTPESYRELWKITREAFERNGADNVVWAFCPDKVTSAEEYMLTYPGDELVDIFGTDVYHFNNPSGLEDYVRLLETSLGTARDEALKRGKIFALTETGNEGLQFPDWYMSVLLPQLEKYRPAYVCIWRNALQTKNPGHFYVPYPGHPQEESFSRFRQNDITLFAPEATKY